MDLVEFHLQESLIVADFQLPYLHFEYHLIPWKHLAQKILDKPFPKRALFLLSINYASFELRFSTSSVKPAYALAPVLFGSYSKIDTPRLGASDNFTFLGIEF